MQQLSAADVYVPVTFHVLSDLHVHACRLRSLHLQGRSGISQIDGFPCDDYTTRFAGEIKDFDPTGYVDKKNARRMDSCIKYTMVAGKKVLLAWTLPVHAHPVAT